MSTIRDPIFKTLLFLGGALATAGFLITKSPAALSWATDEASSYGDLYRFAKIKTFRPLAALPFGNNLNRDSIDQGKQMAGKSDVLFLGDSFGFCDWGGDPFHMQLGKMLAKPMFSIYNNHHRFLWENPYSLLTDRTTHSPSPRILLYEIVERSIPLNFNQPVSTNISGKGEPSGDTSPKAWSALKARIFLNSEGRHETLLKHSSITAPLVEFWNTKIFEYFRQLSSDTPAYSLNPPILFYKDEMASFQSAHSEIHVSTIANNIAAFSRELREHYNCTLVFLPVPNKITVYSHLATSQPYDNFLPRLIAALKSRAICTVDLLPVFKSQKEMLYWSTDTHWNNRAMELAVNATSKAWP